MVQVALAIQRGRDGAAQRSRSKNALHRVNCFALQKTRKKIQLSRCEIASIYFIAEPTRAPQSYVTSMRAAIGWTRGGGHVRARLADKPDTPDLS
jgi:hypothetical protein